jgi:hypothetical protein
VIDTILTAALVFLVILVVGTPLNLLVMVLTQKTVFYKNGFLRVTLRAVLEACYAGSGSLFLGWSATTTACIAVSMFAWIIIMALVKQHLEVRLAEQIKERSEQFEKAKATLLEAETLLARIEKGCKVK